MTQRRRAYVPAVPEFMLCADSTPSRQAHAVGKRQKLATKRERAPTAPKFWLQTRTA